MFGRCRWARATEAYSSNEDRVPATLAARSWFEVEMRCWCWGVWFVNVGSVDAVGKLSKFLLLSGRTNILESSSVNEFDLSSFDFVVAADLLCTFFVDGVLFVLFDDAAAADALGGTEAIDAVAIGSDASA